MGSDLAGAADAGKRWAIDWRKMSRMRLLRRALSDPWGALLAHRVRQRGLTYLGMDALLDLRRAVRRVERDGVPGVIVEAGVALGGSAAVLATSKDPKRDLLLYDVFGMIPPPSAEDGIDVHRRYREITSGTSRGIAGGAYYGYRDNLKSFVENVLTSFAGPLDDNHIELIEGLYEETLHPPQVSFAHVDADWYDSVRICLERIWPQLSEDGVMVLDDYDHWSGCRRAVDEWLDGRTDATTYRRSRLHVRKIAAS